VRATDDSKISLRIRITGTYHLNFTDLGLIPITAMTENERKDKIGNTDGNSSLKTIAGLTREFFDFCLKHTAFYSMVGLEEKYPDTQALLWKGIRSN